MDIYFNNIQNNSNVKSTNFMQIILRRITNFIISFPKIQSSLTYRYKFPKQIDIDYFLISENRNNL